MVEVYKLDYVRAVQHISAELPELTKAVRELTEEIRLLRTAIEKNEKNPPKVIEVSTVEEEFGLEELEG